ncbi:Set1/Ash2 histone methyltransferase complex subunit ASH2, partial [Pichia californica]
GINGINGIDDDSYISNSRKSGIINNNNNNNKNNSNNRNIHTSTGSNSNSTDSNLSASTKEHVSINANSNSATKGSVSPQLLTSHPNSLSSTSSLSSYRNYNIKPNTNISQNNIDPNSNGFHPILPTINGGNTTSNSINTSNDSKNEILGADNNNNNNNTVINSISLNDNIYNSFPNMNNFYTKSHIFDNNDERKNTMVNMNGGNVLNANMINNPTTINGMNGINGINGMNGMSYPIQPPSQTPIQFPGYIPFQNQTNLHPLISQYNNEVIQSPAKKISQNSPLNLSNDNVQLDFLKDDIISPNNGNPNILNNQSINSVIKLQQLQQL